MRSSLIILIALFLLQACQEKKIDQQAESDNLMALSREWAQAAKDRDVDKTVSFWADDAVIMSPDEPSMKGIEAIRKMVDESMQLPGFEVFWEPTEAHVSASGDMGYVIVKNYFTLPVDTLGNTKTITNKGVEIWKKQEDGQWKNVVDIYNGDPTITSVR